MFTHVVPHARRNDDRPIVSDVVRLVDRVLGPAELDAAAPRSDAKELVEVWMRLATDVLSGSEPHDRQLHVPAGVEHGPERLILERGALDVADPSEHLSLSPRTADGAAAPTGRRRA